MLVNLGLFIRETIKCLIISIIIGVVIGIFLPPVGAIIGVLGILLCIPIGWRNAKEKINLDIMKGFDEALRQTVKSLDK